MWYSERFSKGQAWVDLLLLANHSDKKILFNGEFIIVERGQYLTSMVKLAEKWKWSRPTVTKFLNLLEKDKMITRSSDNSKTLITIENYGIYQDFKEDDLQPTLQPSLQGALQHTLQDSCNPIDNPINNPLYTNNNDKNVNNVKNEEELKNEKNIISSNSNELDCQTQDVRRALEAWNELGAYGIKTVGKLKSGTQRYQMLQARIREYGIDDVLTAIDNIKVSDFLQGKHSGNPWQITFDWFVRPNNFPKVLDGNYNNETGGNINGHVGTNDGASETDPYANALFGAING